MLASLVLFISCAASTGSSSVNEEEEEKTASKINFITEDVNYNIQELAGALGKVNRIVDPAGNVVTGSGSNLGNRSAARFANGEELYYSYPNLLYFYAYLVEYDEFTNSDVLNWMEKNEFNSVSECSFHQGYKNVTLDPRKKYVEVCSEVDSNNKVIYGEIRIHYPRTNGETDGEGKFYGKACHFDPSFTIDLNAGKDIRTKEEAVYVYGDGWNEGENPYAGKTFKYLKYEYWSNGVLKDSQVRDGTITFEDDVIIYKQGNTTATMKYFWNTKHKCLYIIGTFGGGASRWELNGNELKSIWGIKCELYNGQVWKTYEDYQYNYYELIQ